MNTVADLLLFVSVIGLITGLAKPALFARFTKDNHARTKIGAVFGVLLIVSLIILAANAPKTTSQSATTTTSTTSSTKPTTSNQPQLRGIGETDAAWNASHVADNQFTSGKAYDPSPNSIYGDASSSKNNDKYVATVHQDGVISNYTMQIKHGISQSQAQGIAMQEMPTDATTVSAAANSGGCYLIALHSNLLANSLAQNDSQNQGGIIIELDTISSTSLSYDANNVNSINIRLASYPSGTSSATCEG